jgi:hypothetical protein
MVSFRSLNRSGVVAAMAGGEVQLPYHTPCTPRLQPPLLCRLIQCRQILPLHHPQIAQQPQAIEPLDTLFLGPLQEHAVVHAGQAVHSHAPLRLHQQEPIQRIDVFRQYPE